MNAKETNLHMLEIVAGALKELASVVVFVGGATGVLYLAPFLTVPFREFRADWAHFRSFGHGLG